MTSPRVAAANRQNARKSTGPTTPAGKVASSRNALRDGLFTALAVVPALGETAAAFDALRADVARDLGAAGPVERAVAEKVAGLLVRQRRIAAYEAATIPPAVLPPHPDEVAPLLSWNCRPPPPSAPPAERLAHCRASCNTNRGTVDGAAAAVAILGPARRMVAGLPDWQLTAAAAVIVRAASGLLGWSLFVPTNPWRKVVAALSVDPPEGSAIPWTPALLRQALDRAATDAGLRPPAFRGRVRTTVVAEATAARGRLAELERQERDLIDQMLADRARAAAAAAFADDRVLDRVARAEAHVSRELGRALGLLERVRAGRARGRAGSGPGPRRVVAVEATTPDGFVLPKPRPGGEGG